MAEMSVKVGYDNWRFEQPGTGTGVIRVFAPDARIQYGTVDKCHELQPQELRMLAAASTVMAKEGERDKERSRKRWGG